MPSVVVGVVAGDPQAALSSLLQFTNLKFCGLELALQLCLLNEKVLKATHQIQVIHEHHQLKIMYLWRLRPDQAANDLWERCRVLFVEP